MEDSSERENHKLETEVVNSQKCAESDKTENEFSTFDFAESTWVSDFVLIVEGTRLYVAKNILAFTSPVFERMFKSEFKESSSNELELPGKSKSDVLEFLRYIYPGAPVVLTHETALRILPLTEEYQVLKLKERCEKALIESIDSTTQALELLQVLQQACLFELRDLREKCVEFVSEKSTAELNEAKEEYQVSTDVLVEVLEKGNEKLMAKVTELEALVEKQRKSINNMHNNNAIAEEENEVIQQYFATVSKTYLAKDKGLVGDLNWRIKQVVLVVDLKRKGVAAEKEVDVWDTRLEVSASVSNFLDIRIKNKGKDVRSTLAIYAVLVCRQPKGQNETIQFSDSLSGLKQSTGKTLKKVNDINESHHGFVRHGKIGLIIVLYMSEPNTD